jgi:hypothetical protein
VSQYHRLRTQLEQSFEIAETRIAAGGGAFVLQHPRVSEDLIDEAAFEHDERLPYWADIWPSARVLADHVTRHEGERARALDPVWLGTRGVRPRPRWLSGDRERLLPRGADLRD